MKTTTYYLIAILLSTLAATPAQAQNSACTARDNKPCVTLDFAPVPPSLPDSLHLTASQWRHTGPAGDQRVYDSTKDLHTQIESEWRDAYPNAGNGTGTPWNVRRTFLIGNTVTPQPWTSLLMIERWYFGGAHGNYQVISKTTAKDGTTISWADLLKRTTSDLEDRVREQLGRRYRNRDFEEPGLELLPPDAWRATPEYLELWWNPYRIGPFAMEYQGPPRIRTQWAITHKSPR